MAITAGTVQARVVASAMAGRLMDDAAKFDAAAAEFCATDEQGAADMDILGASLRETGPVGGSGRWSQQP